MAFVGFCKWTLQLLIPGGYYISHWSHCQLDIVHTAFVGFCKWTLQLLIRGGVLYLALKSLSTWHCTHCRVTVTTLYYPHHDQFHYSHPQTYSSFKFRPPNKKKKEKRRREKKICFTDERTFQVGSVGRDIFFKYIFFLSGGQNYSPKKKKKKNRNKISQKSDMFFFPFFFFFLRQIWEKDFQLFPKIFSQFSLYWPKNGWSIEDMILKAYSLMLNWGRSQNFQNLNFLHISIAQLKEAQFPKGTRLKSFQYEMRAIFTESLVHETIFNTVVMGAMKHT